ncbi:MAG TPA: hypothetical protein VN132_15335 [Bdellovibrio sp.]|nr:hypothetical protein [Bdellovibrio sp.]
MAELTGTNKSSSSPAGASYRPSSLSSSTSSSPSSSRDMSASLREAYANVQKRAQEAISSSEDFVKERPLRTVLGAAAVGFLAGVIARRRH